MSNQTFIFEARLLFTGVDVLSDAALAISDGRIIAMGPSDDVRKTTAADRIISTAASFFPGW